MSLRRRSAHGDLGLIEMGEETKIRTPRLEVATLEKLNFNLDSAKVLNGVGNLKSRQMELGIAATRRRRRWSITNWTTRR